MRRPRFRCQDYAFELTGDPRLVSTLEALLVDLLASETDHPHVWDIETFEAHARVIVDGTHVGRWVLQKFLPTNVISTLTVNVIAAHPTTLHLHAGAVVVEGTTALLVGTSGSGKSTLTCALVAAGAEYRTDEVVAVAPGGTGISTYPKPLSVKATGIEAVERLTGMSCPHRDMSWHFPASAIGSLAVDEDAPVTTIAFYMHESSQPTWAEPLHRATAVRLILADSQDAVVIGPQSLVAAAGLAQSAHCLQVTGGDAAEVARAVLDAHSERVQPGEVVSVPAPGRGGSPARAADVQSVVVDGRAVLYTPEPHRLVELDESQTVWWLLLDGTPFDQIVEEVVLVTGSGRADVIGSGRTFVDDFRSLGVLGDP